MYDSLLHPWSAPHLATPAEQLYRQTGHVRTKGTIFLLPPPLTTLRATYNAPPRPKTRMSSGAVALCKHFERGGASSEHGRAHPYWTLPVGSNDAKTGTAEQVLEKMLAEVVWRNVMLLHPGVAVYEVRNSWGWGMRWTLDVVDDRDQRTSPDTSETTRVTGHGLCGVDRGKDHNTPGTTQPQATETDTASKSWRIVKTAFRGFVEPIEGMDHELDR